MQLLRFTVCALLFFLHSRADNLPSSLEWPKNTWTIDTIEFSSWIRENSSHPGPSLSGHFYLYYDKRGPCTASPSSPTGSQSQPDQESCGIDMETSKVPILCRMCDTIPGQSNTLFGNITTRKPSWQECDGRRLDKYTESENCKGKTRNEKLKGVGGCIYRYDTVNSGEDKSERPWVKWRVAAFNIGFLMWLDSYNEPSNFFRSITYEVVVGQRSVSDRVLHPTFAHDFCRYLPGGQPAPENQIVVYNTTLTVLWQEMKCWSRPDQSYSCALPNPQSNSSVYLEPCISGLGKWPVLPPHCGRQVKVSHRLMPLSEFKETYSK
jgi:hypothetical protein